MHTNGTPRSSTLAAIALACFAAGFAAGALFDAAGFGSDAGSWRPNRWLDEIKYCRGVADRYADALGAPRGDWPRLDYNGPAARWHRSLRSCRHLVDRRGHELGRRPVNWNSRDEWGDRTYGNSPADRPAFD